VRPGKLPTTIVGVLLALALALVAPAAGPARDRAHDLVSVHLIFPHHHDAHAGHDPTDGDDPAWGDARSSFGQPAISSAGPLVDGASLAGNGLLLAGLAFALSLRVLRLGNDPRVPAPHQRWDAVPVRPPR
jgi:hypothetical protein